MSTSRVHRPSSLLASLSLAALSTAVAAQGQPNIYFVPSADVESWCLAGSTCCLATITPRDVAVVQKATCQDCAYKLAPQFAWNTLVGDDDGDALYHQANLFGEIDALMFKPAGGTLPNMRQMFISPKRPLGRSVSGVPGLRPGDVGAIIRNGAGLDGQVVHFLRVEHVRSAFGLSAAITEIDVDAVAADSSGNVFLSLDADHAALLDVDGVLTPFTIQDGAILVIPTAAITYDARGNVASVLANRGMILRSESAVDGLVASAGIHDHTATCVSQIGDTDALEVIGAGQLVLQWGRTTMSFSHLAVGGQRLTGLGVITTAGTVMAYGPTPCLLARQCGGAFTGPTTGFEMGVQAVGGGATSASLGALAFDLDLPAPYAFFVDTCTPSVATPATVALGVHGGQSPSLLMVSIGPSAAAGVAPSLPSPWLPTAAHPDLYIAGYVATLPVPASGTLSLAVPGGVTANLVFQALTIDAVSMQPLLSTPGTLVLR